MDLGPHAAFIWLSYALVVLVLVALVGWLFLDGRRFERQLEDLDARGIRRHSAKGSRDAAT